MMCEVPSNIIELHRFLACGIMGISDGTNDMTQFLYAADRDGGNNTKRYVAKGRTVQILFSVALVITREQDKYHGLCGQMVSDYPETIPMLVALGIDSFGVDIDKVDVTRNLTAQAEAAFVDLTFEEYQERFDELDELFAQKRQEALAESPAYLIANGLKTYAAA
jgi:phosphoenolpyruvate-protein kinase (PTS system EI component)